MKVAVIGGGAAGFFAALSCRHHHPDASITIYEKSGKLLSKVKVSGGGRCNVTNGCTQISKLAGFYPRGSRQLKKAFGVFSTQDTFTWFESRGVKLKTEPDNRVFPISNDSQTIIDCLMDETKRSSIVIKLNQRITGIKTIESGYQLEVDGQGVDVNKIIIATGGSPKIEGFAWLRDLGHTIEAPVPSLFTFNMPGESIKKLMGLSVHNVAVRVQGTKLKEEGPLLVTHWGMSGPAILKLSAYGARVLHELNYNFNLQVCWVGADTREKDILDICTHHISEFTKRKIINRNPFDLPNRLWEFLLHKIELREDITWGELGKKGLNKLINILLNDVYTVKGKTTFKEEFVTCGGVSLADIDFNTMQSKKCKGIYFAGEVLDIDGVTGGFNFQAAWTTGYMAGKLNV